MGSLSLKNVQTNEVKMKLIDIEGIGPKYGALLDKAGIRGSASFLKKGATPKGRKEMAEKAGISEKLILEWVNHCDLMRVRGVGPQYSDLLEEAGVDTVIELSKRRVDNLIKAMAETNAKKNLVRQLPTQAAVTNWIEQAKKMDRVIKY